MARSALRPRPAARTLRFRALIRSRYGEFALHRMSRLILSPLLLVISMAIAACGGGGSSPGEDAPPAAETNGQVLTSSAKATQNGATYSIRTFLPASYVGGTASLPVIYATEGDAPYGVGGQSRFDAFKEVMQRRKTQAILVGISGTARRNTDFLLPGAAQYVDFIAKDLAPAIERQYRVDPKKRALSGLSHGGYLVVAALVLEGTTGTLSFSHYLSTESSYGGHASVFDYLSFEKQLQASGKAVPATLLLAGARTGNGAVIVAPLHAQMTSQALADLTIVKADYDTTHVGADLPAFEEALTRYFP
jgi:enterochelin esterase-like enzyme